MCRWIVCLGIVVMMTFATAVGVAGDNQGQPAMSPEQQAMVEAWQQAMTPGPQHAALAKMEGSYSMTVKMWMAPGAEPEVSTATSERRMIMGGRYLEETVHGTAMGEPFEGRGLTGYDNLRGEYWGVWIDNMSTGVSTSSGSWDDTTGVGTFTGSYVDPVSRQTVATRMTLERHPDRSETMTTYEATPDGEVRTMEIVYQPR